VLKDANNNHCSGKPSLEANKLRTPSGQRRDGAPHVGKSKSGSVKKEESGNRKVDETM